MSDRQVDDLLSELREALAAEPSAAFVPRLRAEAERRLQRRVTVRPAVAGGLALAMGLAGLALVVSWPDRAIELDPPAGVASGSDVRLEAGRAADTSRTVSVPSASDGAARPAAPTVVTAAEPAAASASDAPLVLVPPDQRLALERLLRAWSRGHAALPSEPDPAEAWPRITELPEIPPIEIPLLPGTPAPSTERNPR